MFKFRQIFTFNKYSYDTCENLVKTQQFIDKISVFVMRETLILTYNPLAETIICVS